MVFLISYDLRQPGRDYADLHKAIKSFATWAKPLESVWLVDTYLSAKDIYARLSPYLDQNDLIFITPIGRGSYGVIPREVWTWLANRVYA